MEYIIIDVEVDKVGVLIRSWDYS